jgi:hypothetical protein
MTLQEKFRESDSMNWRNAENVKIADEFAIGFAEWVDSDFYQGDDVNEYHKSILEYREGKIFTVKELLEIYKKEKGL